jgi:hypothetical protein
MTAPNMIALNTVNGNTVGANLTTTSSTVVLSNPASSNHAYKINTLNVSNGNTSSAATITLSWNNAASGGGTAFPIAANIIVPAQSTLNVIDKSSQYYLQENTSLNATANIANVLIVTCSYEDLS